MFVFFDQPFQLFVEIRKQFSQLFFDVFTQNIPPYHQPCVAALFCCVPLNTLHFHNNYHSLGHERSDHVPVQFPMVRPTRRPRQPEEHDAVQPHLQPPRAEASVRDIHAPLLRPARQGVHSLPRHPGRLHPHLQARLARLALHTTHKALDQARRRELVLDLPAAVHLPRGHPLLLRPRHAIQDPHPVHQGQHQPVIEPQGFFLNRLLNKTIKF